MDLPGEVYSTVEDQLSAATLKIKGSKFIVHVLHVSCAEDADLAYQGLKKKFHDATHNCYAYRIDRQFFRYSDDGEPSGTAGKPIFQVIEGRELYQTLIVITRYYGGTKLGTGGLMHAYSDAAAAGLDVVKTKRIRKTKTLQIITFYDKISLIENLINKYHGTLINSEYKEVIRMQIAIPENYLTEFQQAVMPLIKLEDN